MTIKSLIGLLREAKGPDRWFDAKIDAALRIGSEKMRGGGYEWAWDNFPTWAHHKQARGMCGVQHSNGDLGLIWDSPEFTASVDAAIALAERVLPGCWYLLGKGKIRATEPLYGAQIMFGGDDVLGEGEHDFSPAIAICLAILRAIPASSEGQSHE